MWPIQSINKDILALVVNDYAELDGVVTYYALVDYSVEFDDVLPVRSLLKLVLWLFFCFIY